MLLYVKGSEEMTKKNESVSVKYSSGVKPGVKQEQSVISVLKDMVKSDVKIYYILFKYAPELLPKNTKKTPIKTWEDLKNSYKCYEKFQSEEACRNYMYEENVQKAVKWLLGRKRNIEMIELYQRYIQLAKDGNVQAFKAVLEFSNGFFEDNGQSELMKILSGFNLESGADTTEDENFDIGM